MTATPRYEVVEGPIARILGSHQTNDVTIEERTVTNPHAPALDAPVSSYQHTETHTFVNTEREFAMLFEVKGRTLKLVSNDYIAAAPGDMVRAVCVPSISGPLIVCDWHNVTRAIRFRTIAEPLPAVTPLIAWTLLLLVVGIIILIAFRDTPDGATPMMIGVGLVIAAMFLAIYTVRRASIAAKVHAELDRHAT